MFTIFSACAVRGETQLSHPAERSLSTNIFQHQDPQLIFISSCRIIRKQNLIAFATGNLLSEPMQGKMPPEGSIVCKEVIQEQTDIRFSRAGGKVASPSWMGTNTASSKSAGIVWNRACCNLPAAAKHSRAMRVLSEGRVVTQ